MHKLHADEIWDWLHGEAADLEVILSMRFLNQPDGQSCTAYYRVVGGRKRGREYYSTVYTHFSKSNGNESVWLRCLDIDMPVTHSNAPCCAILFVPSSLTLSLPGTHIE